MFSNIGALEIGIVALLILVFFGGKKLPEFIRSLGESVKEFNKGMKGEDKK
jgi:sec-independent protein translocase protein TatA